MVVTDLKASEFDEYTSQYIRKVPIKPLLELLASSKMNVVSLLEAIPKEKEEFKYAPDKWTIKEVVQHVIDTERVFSYRALRFSRRDSVALPGFDVDDYVLASNANARSMADLIEEYQSVRACTQMQFASLAEGAMTHIGSASGSQISVRAIGFKLVGHEMHHCEVINERYL